MVAQLLAPRGPENKPLVTSLADLYTLTREQLLATGWAHELAASRDTLRAAVTVSVTGATDLEVAVVVSTVAEAKGLEFDAVLVVDPAGITGESPRGLNDLYVALTRATRSVEVLHPGDLPAVLARLSR